MVNKDLSKIKWGEIYTCDLGKMKGSVQCGVRPVLVVQTNKLNGSSPTVVVAVITSVRKREDIASHIPLETDCGLNEPSMVMLEQIRTVNQSELTKYIGFVDSEYLQKRINVGLKKVLGFWVERPPKRKNDIRCLCGKCLNDYKSNPAYIIRRLDPFENIKHQCDKCSGSGYDYIIYDRSSVRR